jgi:hypothetical protein
MERIEARRGCRLVLRGDRAEHLLHPVSNQTGELPRPVTLGGHRELSALRLAAILLVTLGCLVSSASEQVVADDSPPTTNHAPATVADESEKRWAISASVYTYLVPDDRDYAQPTITADHRWLHLEARYNYEGLETGSLWVGANFSGGKKLTWEFTPMLGGVFGDTAGVAPGYKGSLSWWKLSLYSEGEYVANTRDSSESFFYNWSELTIAPVEWFRIGMVTQRTRVYHTDREVQRGVLAGFSYKRFDFTTYLFNPDESKPVVVLAVALKF